MEDACWVTGDSREAMYQAGFAAPGIADGSRLVTEQISQPRKTAASSGNDEAAAIRQLDETTFKPAHFGGVFH